MRKVIRGYAKDKNLNLILVGTIPVPHRWEEFRLYHRKDGKVVKEGDDLMCATRYGLMMLRHANTKAAHDRWRREIDYPKSWASIA